MPLARLSKRTKEWKWVEWLPIEMETINDIYKNDNSIHIKFPPLLATIRTTTNNNKYNSPKTKHIYVRKLKLQIWNWKLFVHNALWAVTEFRDTKEEKVVHEIYMQKNILPKCIICHNFQSVTKYISKLVLNLLMHQAYLIVVNGSFKRTTNQKRCKTNFLFTQSVG